jgi:hypothetical protein
MGKKARLATRQRVAQMRAEQARAQRRRTIAIVASLVAAAVVVAAVVTVVVIRRQQGGPSTAEAAAARNSTVQTFKVESGHTTSPVRYPQTPPAGGRHHPQWQNCGVYDEPVKSENAVHSMEHGAVWITYDPGLSSGDVDKLRAAVRGMDYVLLSPYDGLPTPVVASAWGKQQRFTGASDTRLTGFLRSHVKGPQTPEPGAPCHQGIGEPLR